MSIRVNLCSGLTTGTTQLGQLAVLPQEIQAACGQFGSTYILRMGLHYQRYVLGGTLPKSPLVHDIYLAANPAPRLTTKKRATSVTGNIGESILAIVARRMLGATQALDVLPLNVTPTAKCPDFRIRIDPLFPASFALVTAIAPAPTFSYWPAESKTVESAGRATGVLKKALLQLGSYWYERRHLESEVAGFGLVCCFIYKGTKAAPQQLIRMHVFVPQDQLALQNRIDHFRNADDKAGFLQELATPGSPVRNALKDA